jgi:signal transduction histidine kinase/GAF domain-containing protein
MNIPFQYHFISTHFIAKLCELVLAGESTVLLGARYVGKRQVMFRINRYLSEAQAGPVVWIKFLNDHPVSTGLHARALIERAVIAAEPSLEMHGPSDDLLDGIDELYRHTGKRVVLMAANVDGMAHHLARRFLQGIRKRVQDGQLVVVLSGEDDFRDLVYGPNSEFNCANQFVLQGFAEDEFNDYIDRYLALLREDFKLSSEMRQEFWRRTGGSGYLMSMVLGKLIEDHVRATNQGVKFEVIEIPTSLKKAGISGIFGAHEFSHATGLISREPNCWDDLERMINGKTVRVVGENNPPSRLELAGVATRQGNQLLFASELMQNYVRDHYDNRRFGDLYASAGMWERAFERYARLSLEETMRPSGADDKATIEGTVNALCSALHSEAARGVESLQNLFVKGCRYLLGFRDITFWKSEAEWEPLPLKGFTPKREALEEIANLFPQDRSLKPGLLRFRGSLDKCSIAAILPTLGQDDRGAVVIGDFEKRTVISLERARLARKVLGHFISAYSHAIDVEKVEQRLQVRNEHIEIINSIFDVLGSEVINARQVIVMAATKLRRLGYSRVLFCLVDPKHKRIQGVWDDSDDQSVNVAEMTDWPLDPPTADLHPYVVFTKQPKIVPDATKEPLANPTVVGRAKMKSEAIVPILNVDEEAIGTIHIERIDGSVPRQHEVDDLLLFGRQLAVVIEQSERVNMLQSALDKTPEPVLIIDSLERTRYANKMAHDLIGVSLGWQTRSHAQPLSGDRTQEMLHDLRKTLDDEHRRVHHLKGIGKLPYYRGAVLFDKIQDWRGQTVGALLHVQDLNYIYRVFEAFRFIAEANDIGSAMQSMLESMERLGHKWGRLYVVDEQDTDRLISKLSYGPMQQEDQKAFNQGDVVLQLHSDPNQIDWKCIDERNPLVFRWDEDREDAESMLTEPGLRVINVKYPFWPTQIRKEPGDFWIDFPLITEEKILGKMHLQCDPDFRPEDFEMLKVLSKGLLDAFVRREREFERQKQLLQLAADNTLGVTAHSINSHIATISALLTEYRENEDSVKELKELNDRFEAKLTRISAAIRRMTERLGPLNLNAERFDLVELVRQALSNSLPNGKWEIVSKDSFIDVSLDYHLMDSVLTELIHNSKAFHPETDKLSVQVNLELESRSSTRWVKIIYRDNGPGVPPELKHRIFDEFFSQRPGQRRSTGIGLSFVRRVVQAHGGAVSERGQPGKGAEFVIVLPRETIPCRSKGENQCFAS